MEEKRNEAIKRMELLKISKKCISEFKKGNVWESEGYGALYELNDEEKEIVKKFETKHKGYVVYHLIHNMFEFGECYTILYVSDEKTEWKEDLEDLANGYSMAYVYNKDDEWCSEFGTVGIRSQFGGLVRTC